MVELFANSADYDQMPHSAPSDLCLHFLPDTHLGVSSLQWVNPFMPGGFFFNSLDLSISNIRSVRLVFINIIFYRNSHI